MGSTEEETTGSTGGAVGPGGAGGGPAPTPSFPGPGVPDGPPVLERAVEWENVVTYLYSYFWDVPDSWEIIRKLKHPDATRESFLRAGGARVVLTIRKGWEDAWVRFSEGGFKDAPIPEDHPYLSAAQEIAAYDNRNYPGIPPANPARTATRLEESVVTTSNALAVPNSTDPNGQVTIKVASSTGFTVGSRVLIGSRVSLDPHDTEDRQEERRIVAVPDQSRITVDRLDHRHDGTITPFAVVQPGEKGALIAEWNEYTPSSGTDIQLNTSLPQVS